MEKEDRMLLASLEDRARRSENRNMMTHSGFLSPAQQEVFRASRLPGVLFGGYEDAERRIAVFLQERMEAVPEGEDSPLRVLRAQTPEGSPALGHRDYLGALLGLGIDRSVAGDILVRDGGADIIVLREMADFLLENYVQVARSSISASILGLEELCEASFIAGRRRDTVASLRLDSVAASAFSMSRSAAQEAVRQGLVFVNDRQTLKPDRLLEEGDKVRLKGKGKAVLSEIAGKSRKDRHIIVLELYR